MSTSAPERLVTESTDLFEDHEFDIICDIYALGGRAKSYPPCPGDKAEWVAWRANCCPQSPRYRLICTDCKRVYQGWQANNGHISCADCGYETGGFISFTPLRGKA